MMVIHETMKEPSNKFILNLKQLRIVHLYVTNEDLNLKVLTLALFLNILTDEKGKVQSHFS